MISQTIAHYRITGKLGEGGMGEVYRAIDTKLGREVAIKILPATLASDSEFVARFQREAQVLASLNHPNIAAIYGLEDKAIVMELVEGEDLHAPVPLEDALPIARQIAEALEAAHERGIIHRDLKPRNIKITPQGTVKILDFGLAKSIEARPAVDPVNSPTRTMGSTQAGMIMGTASYMAPEQARGKAVDRRADIWAYGAVLFEMLSGRQVFTGETVTDILASVMKDEPDWSALPATTPPRIRKLIERCLKKDPRQRLQAIGEARLIIDEPETHKHIADPVKPSSARLPWAIAALAGVALIGTLAWFWPREVSRPLVQLNVDMGAELAPGQLQFSPDGKYLAYRTRNADRTSQLVLRHLDQPNGTPVPDGTGATSPFFSPDGQWIAFSAGDKLRKVPVTGGASVVICEKNSLGGSWGSDGFIVFSDGRNLFRVAASGGEPKQLTDPKTSGEAKHRAPQHLPDNNSVVYTAALTEAGFNDSRINVLDLRTGKSKTVVPSGYFGQYLPSGHLVYINQETMFGVRFDLDNHSASGTPVPLREGIRVNDFVGNAMFAASKDGIFVYSTGQAGVPSTILSVDRNGAQTPVLPRSDYRGVRFSPDGTRIAYTDGTTSKRDVWVRDMLRETSTRITFTERSVWEPVWTPDSKHLIYARNESVGGNTLWWTRADGAGEPVQLLQTNGPSSAYSISPDSKTVAVSEINPGGSADIVLLPLDVSDTERPKPGKTIPFLVTRSSENFPSISPDSRWIAYTSNESGRTEVYVRAFPGPGGKWQISSGGGGLPEWSRSSRELLFLSEAGFLMSVSFEIRGTAFVAAKPRTWTSTKLNIPQTPNQNITLSPDGKRLLAITNDSADQRESTHLIFLLNYLDEIRRKIAAGQSK